MQQLSDIHSTFYRIDSKKHVDRTALQPSAETHSLLWLPKVSFYTFGVDALSDCRKPCAFRLRLSYNDQPGTSMTAHISVRCARTCCLSVFFYLFFSSAFLTAKRPFLNCEDKLF